MMTRTFSKLTEKLMTTSIELETLTGGENPDEFRTYEIELKFKEINNIVSMLRENLDNMFKPGLKEDKTTLQLLNERGR